MPANIKTVLQARTTKTAPFQSTAVDVSALTGDVTIKLKVYALTAGNSARFELEESVDSFTTVLATGLGVTLTGGNLPVEGDVVTWKRRDLGNLSKFGVANGKCRVNLSQLDAGASVDFEAFVIS